MDVSNPDLYPLVLARCCLAPADDLQAHGCHTAAYHADGAGSPSRQINHPATGEGTTIINANHHRSPGVEVGYAHLSPKGQIAVGRGHGVLVKHLAAGAAVAVESGAVPGCNP